MIFIEHLGQLDQIIASISGNERLELSKDELILARGSMKMKLLQLGKKDDFIVIRAIVDTPLVNERPQVEFGPRLQCKQCEHEIISIPVVKRVVNLPSTYYKELMECFTCHDQRIDTKFEVKGTQDQILRTSTFAIFSKLNMVPKSLDLKVRNYLRTV
jgi:hypothetical protein